jgi:sugar/nucleoside kinase (ribokinase family)
MDILGIGNAILDVFCFSDDETALALGLHPNRASHVTPERLDELFIAVPSLIYVSGGSAANSTKVASALGASCAFVGCVGTEEGETDRWARLFERDLSESGVACALERRVGATGRCLVIHMPGGLKSIACAPSVAPSLTPAQIDETRFSLAKIALIDGQTLANEPLVERIATLCESSGIPLAIDLASPDIALERASAILKLIQRVKCVLFANDDEALALARAIAAERGFAPGERVPSGEGTDGLIDQAFSRLAQKGNAFPCLVRKMGPSGARAWSDGASYFSATEPVAQPLDDTGAGDAFNGAFLASWVRDRAPQKALDAANAAARETLSVPGTRLDADRFESLKGRLSR